MAQTARILTLAPAAGREFQECPRGCMGHEDTASGRRHVGMRASLSAKTPAGKLADIDLRAEYHDDGHGGAHTVYVLSVAGGQPVELDPGSMHWLMRKWDDTFWSMGPRKSMNRFEADYGPAPASWAPEPVDRSAPVVDDECAWTRGNHGGRA